MLHYVHLFFQERKAPVVVPVEGYEAKRLEAAVDREAGARATIAFFGIADGSVAVNAARLEIARFTSDGCKKPAFGHRDIKPSRQFPEFGEPSPREIEAASWELHLVKAGGGRVRLVPVSGTQYAKCREWFGRSGALVLEHDEGRETVLRGNDVDLIYALELERYSPEQLEAARRLIWLGEEWEVTS